MPARAAAKTWERFGPGMRLKSTSGQSNSLSGKDKLLLGDAQFVSHREDSRNSVRTDIGQVLVSVVVHDAFQDHMTVIDDDVDVLVGLSLSSSPLSWSVMSW